MTVETRPKRGGPSQGGRDPGGNGPDATEGRRAGRDRPGSARDRRGVVGEIAARRLADLRPALEAIDRAMLRRQVAAAPAPRPFADRLAAPGLHLIAEIKRRSPSAGEIASMGEDIVARARAYQAGGAAAISVLCEPHWFGGSVEDLATVRSAVSIPVLAKEFVVDARQLDLLRAAGADAVLLLAVLHPRRGLAKLVGQALDLGLEPLVEAHDERELEAALSTRARVIGINNRDLRTLAVDPERASAMRDLIPEDRLAVAESGVRDASTIRGWRALGFDAALVGETLIRAGDPAAAARAFVAAGSPPSDVVEIARRPFVKICGVTDAAGITAAVRAGADAIGLNLVPGTPRALTLAEAAELAQLARASAPPDRTPLIVAITVDRTADDLRGIAAALDADAIQLNGKEPVSIVAALGRPAWKVLHLPPDNTAANLDLAARTRRQPRAPSSTPARPESSSTRRAARTQAVPASAPIRRSSTRSPGRSRSCSPAGSIPRRSADALRSAAAIGVDVASGVEGAACRRPSTDARTRSRSRCSSSALAAARADRPNLASRPTPVDRSLVEADGRGRWGIDRGFGGRYVPETLMAALAAARVGICRAAPRPPLLGGAPRAARHVRRSADAAVPGGPTWPSASSSARGPPRPAVRRRRRCAST